jgi:hypothetical protein
MTCVLPEESKERLCEKFEEYDWCDDLHPCRIKGKDTEWLAEVLVQCPTLTHLNLNFNVVGGHFANKFRVLGNFFAKSGYVTPASQFVRFTGVLPQC